MLSQDSGSEHGQPLRCAACGDVVGVYEPLVEVLDGLPRRTSRGSEPDVCRSGGECYHVACFEGEVSS